MRRSGPRHTDSHAPTQPRALRPTFHVQMSDVLHPRPTCACEAIAAHAHTWTLGACERGQERQVVLCSAHYRMQQQFANRKPWAIRCRCSPDSSRASPELSKASSSRARRPTDRQHMSTCRGVVSRLGAAAQASLRRRPVRQRTDALRSGTRYHSTYSMCRAQPLSVRGCRLPGSLYPGCLGTRCPVSEVEALVRRETVLQRIDGACEEGMESVRYAARSEKRTAAIEARAASLPT